MTHLALSALAKIGPASGVSAEALEAEVKRIAGEGAELPEEELTNAIGEM